MRSRKICSKVTDVSLFKATVCAGTVVKWDIRGQTFALCANFAVVSIGDLVMRCHEMHAPDVESDGQGEASSIRHGMGTVEAMSLCATEAMLIQEGKEVKWNSNVDCRNPTKRCTRLPKPVVSTRLGGENIFKKHGGRERESVRE